MSNDDDLTSLNSRGSEGPYPKTVFDTGLTPEANNTELLPIGVREVPIESIKVGQRKRHLDAAHVEWLQNSIAVSGQTTVITITCERKLLAGAHRLEAMRRLGRVHICAQVVDADGLHAELIEIDENLVRSELTYLQRCRQTRRRKQIYEELYPASKQGGNPGLPGGGKAKTPTVVSFAHDAATKTRQSESTIRSLVQMGEKLEPIAHIIENTPLADSRKALKLLANTPDEDRETEARAMVAELDAPHPKRAKSKSLPSSGTKASVRPPVTPTPLVPTGEGKSPISKDACHAAIGLVGAARDMLLSGSALKNNVATERMRHWGDRLAKTASAMSSELLQQDVCDGGAA